MCFQSVCQMNQALREGGGEAMSFTSLLSPCPLQEDAGRSPPLSASVGSQEPASIEAKHSPVDGR